MLKIKKYSVLLTVTIIAIAVTTSSWAGSYKMTIATFAPKGTVYAKKLSQFAKKIRVRAAEAGHSLTVKILAGGKAGNEKSMLRKLKRNNIQMASFTGIGLGSIVPAVRVLELPFMYRNSAQIDAAVKRLYPTFEKEFAKKGFVLAGWGEAGDVYLMSKQPIATFADMKGKKIWAPAGDPMVKAMFRKFGFVPVFLGFESVLPQLQTGGLTAIYGPPIAVVGLQWHTQIKYVSYVKLATATGANLMSGKWFNALPADLQKIVKDTSIEYAKKTVKSIRSANSRTLRYLLKKRLKKVEVNQAELKILKKNARAVRLQLKGKLYSDAIYRKAGGK